ncbi:hypothetical protein CR513_46177, partial [Mucuna pruriens]
MVKPIPTILKNAWSKWNIKVVILVSLFWQILLIFLAPMRKRSRKNILVFLLWATYLLADYTANFCVGLITNKYGDEDKPSDANDFLFAFWTPFLLLHLGGPDTITAFALEDNELWLRHMLGLIVQVCLTSYVFLLTLPVNTLWQPTALVFTAGIIKFAERTRSLQLASASNFRQSMIRKPDPGPNYAKLMEELKSRLEAGLPTEIVTMPEISDVGLIDPEPSTATAEHEHHTQEKPKEIDDHQDGPPLPSMPKADEVMGNEQDGKRHHDKEELSDVKVVREAFRYFNIFKGLVVDMIFSFHERSESRTFFLKLTALDTLRVIEVELNFIYQAFYTKASAIFSMLGFGFRFLSVCSLVAALGIFVHDPKRRYDKLDVIVTYILLFGAVILDIVSLFMLIFSDHSVALLYSLGSQKIDSDSEGGTAISKDSGAFSFFLKLKRPLWTKKKQIKCPAWFEDRKYTILCRKLLCRRWSESISGFNLIVYCLNKRKIGWVDKVIDYIGAKEVLDQWKYEKKQPLLQKLWIFIFEELERKSGDADDVETIQRICSSRGEWVIQEGELERGDLNDLMPYVERNNVTFDQCLILWHIATDLLFYEGEDMRQEKKDVEKGKADVVVPKNEEEFEHRDFSKLLSDYMLYLLIMQPTMMSAVRGIGQIRFQDTCAEATNFFSKREMMAAGERAMSKLNTMRRTPNPPQGKDTCNKLCESIKKFIKKVLDIIWCRSPKFIQDKKDNEPEKSEEQKACMKLTDVRVDQDPSAVKGDRSKSLLFDACRLANVIKQLKGTNKWKIIAQVWVELLSYAAANCLPITHVQQLSKGGEFLSLVWLLMTHLGLAKQFQIKEGHARAKLIVGEEDQIKSS